MTRLEVAKEFLTDSKLCLDSGGLRSAVSRAYYATFHACVALFEYYGYHPSNFIGRGGRPAQLWEHGVIIKCFPLEFVHRKKMVDWQLGIEVRLYRSRTVSDYRPDMVIAQVLAQESYEKAAKLIAVVERMVS